VRIKSSKQTGGGQLHEKEYILNFVGTEDSEYPTSYRAASTGVGNGVSIIKESNQYYEVHTFITSGTLSFNSVPAEDLTAWVLVVGGGSAGHKPGNGGGSSGGPGITSSITGTSVSYAAGGGSNVPAENGGQGAGNGGRQSGRYTTSYAGGSGIVIVRFPAKPNTVTEN
jgi:hypothetical protein